jgi:phage recombination protein Bet
MGNLAVLPSRAFDAWSASQIALIKRTVAADCNDSEFDLFVTVAKRAGLDPLRKQIYAVVHNKAKPDKRKMTIITGIDGMRAIAAKTGRYRPDEDEPVYHYEAEAKNPATNPLGLLKCNTRIWIADVAREGAWRPVAGVAYWDEFAPITEEWTEGDDGRRRPSGKSKLDTSGQWGKMPRHMLAKCSEATALRKAFPEDLSGLYEAAELDRAQAAEIIDLTPTEQLGVFAQEGRLAKIGYSGGLTFQFSPAGALEPIEVGKVADRCIEAVEAFSSHAQVDWFESVNQHPLREFWARAPSDALAVKKVIERRKAELLAGEQ